MEPFDTSTSSGRFARGMLAELAAYESERVGDMFRETQRRRLALGLPYDGKERFGYRRVNGLYKPDPVTGPVLADMYRLYMQGWTFAAIARRVNDAGHRPAQGYHDPGPFRSHTVASILNTGFGAGLLHVRDEYLPGAQKPVISPEVWHAYRSMRHRATSLTAPPAAACPPGWRSNEARAKTSAPSNFIGS